MSDNGWRDPEEQFKAGCGAALFALFGLFLALSGLIVVLEQEAPAQGRYSGSPTPLGASDAALLGGFLIAVGTTVVVIALLYWRRNR